MLMIQDREMLELEKADLSVTESSLPEQELSWRVRTGQGAEVHRR